MAHEYSAVLEQVRDWAAPLSQTERLALIREIASLETAAQEATFQAESEDEGLDTEQAAWFARPPAERPHYKGQFVAVRGGQVVDNDLDQRTLYLRVRARFGRQPVLVAKADWGATPVLTVHSPRRVR